MKSLEKWIEKNSFTAMRISLGIVFLWFGFLKFFPGASSAELLAGKTINALTFGVISPSLANFILAIWESAIGIGFLWGKYLKQTIILMLVQMLGTFTPLVLFPTETWLHFPYSATIEGQYIIKNLVLLSNTQSDRISKSEK